MAEDDASSVRANTASNSNAPSSNSHPSAVMVSLPSRVSEPPANACASASSAFVDLSANPSTDVCTRMEIVRDELLRKYVKGVYVAVPCCFIGVWILFWLKVEGHLESVGSAERYVRANVFFASACTAGVAIATVRYIVRAVHVTRRGFRWSLRKKRFMQTMIIGLIAQALNSIFYLIPNVMVLVDHTYIMESHVLDWCVFARSTLWNVLFCLFVFQARLSNLWVDKHHRPLGKEDSTLADAPLKSHWFLLVVWIFFELDLVAHHVKIQGMEMPYRPELGEDGEVHIVCDIGTVQAAISGMAIATTLVYQMLGLYYIYRGYSQLKKKPYNMFKWANVQLRYLFLQSSFAGDVVVLSFVLLWFVRMKSCSSLMLTFLGMLPAQVAMSFLTVVNTIVWMPVKPGRTIELSLRHAHFTWTEADKREDIWDAQEDMLSPKFCYETAIKLWYWSLGVYAYDLDTGKCDNSAYEPLCAERAKELYGQTDIEIIRVDESDTNVLLGWGPSAVVVCFRGTYSATNVWTDLQFWRVVHPPKRGHYMMRSQPLIHKGFQDNWTMSDLNVKVLEKVKGIVSSPAFDKVDGRVYVTGHSLGGALAVLASYDLMTHCPLRKDQLSCYTYGAPRVGNHAFVNDYNQVVPDTWQVVNDQDVVPRMPKFWLLFKHVGERVIINHAGDLMVSPLYIETSLHHVFRVFKRKPVVSEHLLGSYRKSLVAITRAQFIKNKRLDGGMDAMRVLFKHGSVLSKALDVDLATFNELHQLGSKVWTHQKEVKNGQRREKAKMEWEKRKMQVLRMLGASGESLEQNPELDSETSNSTEANESKRE